MRKSKCLIGILIAVISLNALTLIDDSKKDIWDAVSKKQIIVLADSCSSKIDTIVKRMNFDSILGLNTKTSELDTFINVTFCIKKRISGKFIDSTFTHRFMKCKNMNWCTYWMLDPINLNPRGCVNDSMFTIENGMTIEHAISLLNLYIKGTLPNTLSKSEEKLINYVKKLSSNKK